MVLYKALPQLASERKRQLGDNAETTRAKDKNVKDKLVTDTLFINGEWYKDPVTVPTTAKLLKMTKDERQAATGQKFIEASEKFETQNCKNPKQYFNEDHWEENSGSSFM